MRHLSSGPQETLAQQGALPDPASRPDAGLMILSSSMRILHINGRARALMTLFGEAHQLWPHLSPESMPAILTEFCGNVFAELRRLAGSEKWAELELHRVCHMVSPALLLRGFGMPGTDAREPRMILTLQPCSPSADRTMLQNRALGPASASTDVGRSAY
jgi:hypothetical protein